MDRNENEAKRSEVSAELKRNNNGSNVAKQLLIALLIVSGISYADCNDPANAQKVVDKLHKWNKPAVQVNYTSDKIDCASTCKNNVLALDKSINVIMKSVSGAGICKFSKPN